MSEVKKEDGQKFTRSRDAERDRYRDPRGRDFARRNRETRVIDREACKWWRRVVGGVLWQRALRERASEIRIPGPRGRIAATGYVTHERGGVVFVARAIAISNRSLSVRLRASPRTAELWLELRFFRTRACRHLSRTSI